MRAIKAHKPTRLVFAILTLSIALSGVIANYALSDNAMRVFRSQINLDETTVFLLSGRLSDADQISRHRADMGNLVDFLRARISPHLPMTMQMLQVQRGDAMLDVGGQVQRVPMLGVTHGFLPQLGLSKTGSIPPNSCILGVDLAQRTGLGAGDLVSLHGRYCTVALVADMPDTPPFVSLNASILRLGEISGHIDGRQTSWTFHISGPAGALSEPALRAAIDPHLDTAAVQIWSSATLAERAQRLVRVLSLVSNGLGFVILIVGASSIASLMSFSVAERSREIAIKSAIGAKRSQIVLEIAAEALAIGAFAAIFGTIGGTYLANWLQEPLGEFLAVGLAEGETLSPWPILQAAIGFLLICFLSGLLPALRAAMQDPAVVLRAP